MFEPVAIITDEFQEAIMAIRQPHIKAAWSILSHHCGHESAISRIDLVKRMRLAISKPKYSERSVRKLCEIIRGAGIPVCSDRNGYWIGTPTETLAWAEWYMAHAFTMLRRARRLVKGALKMTTDPVIKAQAAQMELTLNFEMDGDNGQA